MPLTLSSSLLNYSTDLIMPLTLSSSLLSYSTDLIMPLTLLFSLLSYSTDLIMSLTLSSSLLSYSTDLIMPLTLSSSLLSYSTELIMPLDNQFLSLPQHLSLWIGNGLLIKCVKICIQMNPAQFCICPSRVSLPRWFCLFLRLFDWILELFRYVIYIFFILFKLNTN